MKKKLFFVLFALLGMIGNNVHLLAQELPEPDGMWTFGNAENLLAADKGSLQLLPAVTGSKSITVCENLADAGITTAAGPTSKTSAIMVPAASALKVQRLEGAEATTSYTLMMDVKVLDANAYDGLFQTNEGNTNDGDLFIYTNKIGMNAMGGYFGEIKDDTWYRIVLTNSDGQVKVYVDGEKVITCNSQGRWEIDPWGFYVCCDDNGEMADTYMSGLSFWESPLTDEQVGALGGFKPASIATAEDLVAFANKVNGGETEANAFLTADIDMSGVEGFAGIGVARDGLYAGTFDGQGHKISNMTISYPEKDDVGFFHISTATLKNFTLDESCLIQGSKGVGLVGWCNGDTPHLENIGVAAQIKGGENTSSFIGRAWKNPQFVNCWSVGEIDNSVGGGTQSNTGVFMGWCNTWGGSFTNCWTSATFTIAPADGNYLTRKGDNVTFNNTYATRGSQAIRMADEDLASGALCYNLNGDQSEITWFQTLGTDPYPVLDSSHGRVYKSGKIRCDGLDTGETAYSNTDTGGEVVRPDHQFVDGVCAVCNSYDPGQVVDGVYHIGSARQLVWFSDYVNSGHPGAKAVLTADIDMSEVENFTPIGVYHDNIEGVGGLDRSFTGTFDGAKHIISNLTVTTEDYLESGLFSRIYRATVSNLGIVNVSITTNNPRGRIGALAGLNRESLITNCWSAGVLAYNATDSEQQYGGIAGNTNNTNGRFVSCWSSYEGPLTTESGSFQDCSSYADDPDFLQHLANGALCYALNGRSFIDVTWYQTIYEDNYPNWNASHGIVYPKGNGDSYDCFIPGDPESLQTFIQNMIASETAALEETIADQALLDECQREVDAWADIASYEDFCEAYKGLDGVREAIQASVQAYAAYREACEYAIAYLRDNDFKSDMRSRLETYLYKYVEPGDDYANGSYEYILLTHQLSDEEIAAETAALNDLLQVVIASNIIPGTEITLTLPNYNLKAGLEGWSVSADGAAVQAGGRTDVMGVAEGRSGAFSVSQTLTDVPNGIYMLAANAFSRAGDDATNTLYAGQLFLNGNQNFLMTPIEDIISTEDAKDGRNCLLTGDGADAQIVYGDAEGYVPASMNGCSYAFQAGRYLNQTAVEVSDGTLQLGIRNPGTGLEGDWTAFGNIHVWYLGTADEGNAQLAQVLDGYLDRARVILDFPWSSDLDYNRFPNFSETLKSELSALVESAAQAQGGQAKMDVINALSAKFAQVYDCRRAYIALGAAAEGLLDQAYLLLEYDMIDEATYNETMQVGIDAWEVYQLGSASTEEALALAARLNENINRLGGVEKDENGNYRLKTAKDLMTFAVFVNNGETTANAIMDADIDMSEVENFPGIGVARDLLYAGTFDGQGHTISNMTISYPEKQDVGFFHISTATLRNFTLDESCLIQGSTGVALVGWCNGDTPHFENIGVAAQIKGGENTSSFIGRAWKNPQFVNCWSIGEIDNSVGGGTKSNTGVFMGWCNTWGGSFTNCWTTSTFTVAPADANYLTRSGTNVTFNNTYTIKGSQALKMTEDDVLSGALCYNLNGDQSEIVWYQTLGVDPHPVLDSSHGIVVKNPDGTFANATAIDVVRSPQPQLGSAVFDLFGRRVADRLPADASLPKGIYIVSGRKVLVK